MSVFVVIIFTMTVTSIDTCSVCGSFVFDMPVMIVVLFFFICHMCGFGVANTYILLIKRLKVVCRHCILVQVTQTFSECAVWLDFATGPIFVLFGSV